MVTMFAATTMKKTGSLTIWKLGLIQFGVNMNLSSGVSREDLCNMGDSDYVSQL